MRRALLFVATLAFLLVAAQASGAAAVPVSGTYAVTDVGSLSCAPVDANQSRFRCETTGLVSEYAGSLEGTSTASFVQIIDCRRGRTFGHGVETFTGTVTGVGSGTLTWRISFASDFDCGTFAVSGFTGQSAITGGSGALGGLHGALRFGDVTYEGTLH